MLNNVSVSRYYPIDSFIHRRNPFIKLVCTLLYVISLFLCYRIDFMLCLTFLLVAIFFLAKLPAKIYMHVLLSLKYILIFIILIYVLMKLDLVEMIMTCLRLYLVVLSTTILTLTTSSNDVASSFGKLLSPLRYIGVPVNKISLSLALALRFIPTIIEEGDKIMKSQASRGVDYYESKLSKKFLSIKTMIIPMFILTLRRADSLAEAMSVRQYDINSKRTSLKENKITYMDLILLFIHISITILLIIGLVIK